MKRIALGGVALLWAGIAAAAELSVAFTFSADDVTLTPAGAYTVIDLADGTRPVDEAGAPAIPAKYANVLLPAGAQNVRISTRGDWKLLAQDVVPYPAQPRRPKSQPRAAFVAANARYASAEAWPAELATYEGDQDMQGYRFVSVRVNPLTYVGADRALYLHETVTVTVSYDLATTLRTISAKQKSAFEPLVNSLVVNPGAATTFAPKTRTLEPKAGGAVDYLIITSSALSNAFQQIANYRSSAAGGSYTTRVMTTNDIAAAYAGADIQAKVRACISNAVATLGTTMVVLGGDDTVVPDRNCYGNVDGTVETEMPTDLYYSGLGGSWNADGDAQYGETTDGVDMAWDVIVGRIPVRTAAQATNYLNKVMTYESGSPTTNKIILGGPSAWDVYTGTDRPSDDVTIDGHAGFRATTPKAHASVSDSEAWLRRLYRDGIRSNWPAQVSIMCDTLTSWDTTACGDHLESAANTLAAFNKNYTHLMFSGHGAPQEWGLESGSFSATSASSMTGLAAFVYTDACLTGHFDKNSNTIDGSPYTTEPCLAEGFLRNTRALGGAVAYMGCARFGWGEPDSAPASNTSDGGPSTVYAYKFYKRMYETSGRTLGLAFAMHKADMVSLCGSDGSERWIQFGLNLLGDPALKMPTGAAAVSAPVFGANPGPVSATAGVAVAFVVSASGSPAPALALRSTTASTGYTFTTGTGLLNYAPPAADAGARTFTFTASNSQGVATQVVSVAVSAAPLVPPAAPAAIWASATNANDFTAAWSAVADATGYRLDVGTNSSFSAGGGAGGAGTNCAHSGTLGAGTGGTWTETGLTQGSGYLVSLTGDSLVTPALDLTATTAETLVFKARSYGGTVAANNTITVSVSTDNGATWTSLGTRVPASTTLTAMSPFDLGSYNASQVKVKFETLGATASVGAGLDDVIVTNLASAGTASYLPGYSNRTVAGTSQSVTGLTVGATYYFRARAVSAGGTGTYSTVASVTTLAGAVAPVFGGNPGPLSTTAGVAVAFTVSASGTPAPALALRSTTASAGYNFAPGTGLLSYVPPVADGGATRTFTFTASNSAGVATQTVSVAVAGWPTVTFGAAKVVGEEGGPAVSLPVSLSFAANATVQVAIAGTALAGGTDFTCSATTLVFSAAGAAASNLTFAVANDTLPEGPESARLNLNAMSGATLGATTQAVFFVRDNDAFAVVSANLTSGTNLVNDCTTYDDPAGRILEALQPDVVLIQEWVLKSGTTYRGFVDQYFGTNYSYYVEPESDSYPMPNGIISRWAITNSGQWADANTSGRDFAWARIDLPGLRNLNVVSVHIKATGSNATEDAATRLDEARALTNYIATAGWPADDYLAVGGDLNLTNRTEMTLRTLTNVVSDAHQPADQNGDKETNSGRFRPYDFILPNGLLDARHVPVACYGYVFTNGMVFDTRLTWANGVPPPATAADSAAYNMQHMAVLKVFEFESQINPPQAFAAVPADASRIDLAFTTNASGSGVVVVWNGDGNFGTPSGTAPAVGAAFAGGTVLYKGGTSPQSHVGLTGCSTYFYKCWSYLGANYSTGLTAQATTPGPDALATVWASATNATDFTAAWSAAAGATGYRLDVSTSSNFASGGGSGGLETVFRETMGNPGATVTVAAHEAANGFDNDAYAMSNGGISKTGDVRVSTASAGYVDPLGNAASGLGNVYFTSTAGDYGFGMAGIAAAGYEYQLLSFGYRKELAVSNAVFAVEWSTNGGTAWTSIAVSNLPAANAAAGWYMVSNLYLPPAASGADLSLRWVKTSNLAMRIDDVLLQGMVASAAPSYLPGYSNRTVAGTSQGVTGLTANSTYYFRVRSTSGCGDSANSPTASVATRSGAVAPAFGANPGPLGATTGVAVAFAVGASGSPAPTLALAGTTASSGYGFAPETGVLTYTPPPADAGARTFTFTASNGAGAATQTVSVTVAAAAVSGGLETFANYTNASATYLSGTFVGQDGSTWTFASVRGDLNLNGRAPTLRNTTNSYVRSGTIPGGVGTLQLKYRRPFATTLNCAVYVNDALVGTITGGDYTTQTWASATLNVAGDVVLTFSNKSTSGQITLDDVSWTGYAGGAMAGEVPTVRSLDMQTLMAGKTLTATVTALEADGDAVTFACASAVDASRWTLDANSGAFSFTPTPAEEGLARFDFTATDKDGTSATEPMSVLVTPPPTMETIEPPANGATALSTTIATEAGLTYILQYTTSLTDDPQVWEDADSAEGTGDAVTLQDGTVGTQRFYRVISP